MRKTIENNETLISFTEYVQNSLGHKNMSDGNSNRILNLYFCPFLQGTNRQQPRFEKIVWNQYPS